MSTSFVQLTIVTILLFVLQGLAALPWVFAWRQRPIREQLPFIGTLLGSLAGLGFLAAIFFDYNSDPQVLSGWGRLYMAVLHFQLALDLFVAVFFLLLTVWSKGAAVALASFQEGVRQPMFWLLTGFGIFLMAVSVWIPYFTFGEDLKMVKELCYAFTMMAPAAFGVILACMSISEEIEVRTAVTLLSKPISRRQFLVGKFVGVVLASLLMTFLMGWMMNWIILYKTWYDSNIPANQTPENFIDPGWVTATVDHLLPNSTAGDLARGIGLWMHDFTVLLPGLTIGFCQVLVLVAVAVALATRVPMVVNVSMCLLVYFLGHLTPIMTEVTTRQRMPLLPFVAQLFETLLPGLDNFDVGSAIVRDVPLDPASYALYTANVTLYALMYTAIALLFGLILFEDKDVA
jgi:ABC-type transport system involved in multi-copper enzyme maturation permease subunit